MLSTPAAGVHQFAYDDLNRPLWERHPMVLESGAVQTSLQSYEYVSRGTASTPAEAFAWSQMPGAVGATIHIDALGTRTQTVSGMRGQTVATVDPGGNRTLFDYGPFDHLKKRTFVPSSVPGALSVETSFVSDEFGEVTRMVDPISGVHEYERDGLGSLVEYRHNGAVSTFNYDALGRLDDSTTPDGFYDWVWDGDGTDPTQAERLVSESVTSATLGNSKTSYDYHGPGGAVTGIHREIGGETFDTLIEHEIVTVIGQPPLPIARPKYIRFPVKNLLNQPGLEVAQYTYDRFGRVTTVWDGATSPKKYWELLKTDAYGNDAEVKLMGGTNGVISRKTVEAATGRLSVAETVGANGRALRRERHLYDSRGYLSRKTEELTRSVQTFVNDAYGRLDYWLVNNTRYEYDYDVYGNLKRKEEVGELHYNPAKPYELTGTDSGSVFTYDDAGNGTQVTRVGSDIPDGHQEIEYSSFDLPTRVINGPEDDRKSETIYGYDANNTRVIEQVLNGPRTVYVGDGYRRITQANGVREQIVSIPTPTGMSIEVSINNAGTRAVRALHTDHLGSTVAVTNASGLSAERRDYYPFGGQVSSVTNSTVIAGFTGHQHDTSNALINMRGRMYDPMIGRFITPDPIVQAPGNSQNLNRYSYVMNSPLNFVDPSGFKMVQICGPGMGACEPGTDIGFADDGTPEPSDSGSADGPTAAESGQMINNAERGLLQMPPSMDPGRAGNESWWNNIQFGNPPGGAAPVDQNGDLKYVGAPMGDPSDLVAAAGGKAIQQVLKAPVVGPAVKGAAKSISEAAVRALVRFFAKLSGRGGVAAAEGTANAATGALLRMQLAAEEAAGASLPQEITGYTKHGIEQAIGRDGVGVAGRAILDAFKNPLKILGQVGGRFQFTGQDAVVVLNAEGKVVTTWATNAAGVRVVP